MANPNPQPEIKLVQSADYRENYANSVQIRVNVWDFFLVFGTLQQQTPPPQRERGNYPHHLWRSQGVAS
jgi:hypothetical protein